MSDSCDLEECLSDPRLTDSQRHMLAVALRYHRTQIGQLSEKVDDTSDKIANHITQDFPEIKDNLEAVNLAMWGTANFPEKDQHAKTPALVDLSRQICMVSRIAAIAWAVSSTMIGYIFYVMQKLWGTMP